MGSSHLSRWCLEEEKVRIRNGTNTSLYIPPPFTLPTRKQPSIVVNVVFVIALFFSPYLFFRSLSQVTLFFSSSFLFSFMSVFSVSFRFLLLFSSSNFFVSYLFSRLSTLAIFCVCVCVCVCVCGDASSV